jgi:hypothetical protein
MRCDLHQGPKIMNPLAKLFSRPPSGSEIEQRLKELELDRKKKQRDLTMLEMKKQDKVKQAVEAKKAGKENLLRDLFREISQIEVEIGNSNEELRRFSLSKTALISFQRKIKLLEEKKDRKGLQKLIERFSTGSIQNAIDKASVDDDQFQELLDDVLEDAETPGSRGRDADDPHFSDFERTIAAMANAEDSPPSAPISGQPRVLNHSELEQELAMIGGKITELQASIDDLYRKIDEACRQAAAMHRAARDLMANPDTYEQGVEMEARASAMENVEQWTRMIESLTNMIRSLEERKRDIIRNLA